MSIRTFPNRFDESPVAHHTVNSIFLKAGSHAYSLLKKRIAAHDSYFRYIGDILVQESRFIRNYADYKLYRQHVPDPERAKGPYVIIISADTHRWHHVDDSLETYLGYSLGELENDWVIAYHPDEWEAIDEEITQVLRDLHSGERNYAEVEVRYQTKPGYSVWAQLTFSLVRDWKGTPEYFMVVIRDISMIKWSQLFYHELAALKELIEISVYHDESLQGIEGLMRHYDGEHVDRYVLDQIQQLMADR